MSNPDKDKTTFHFELTSHGKQKLAEGEFTPEYYTFHDDVIYDYDYTSGSEDVGEIVDRLVNSEYTFIENNVVHSGNVDERPYQNRIGTMEQGQQEAPAMEIRLYGDADVDSTNIYPDRPDEIDLGTQTVKILKTDREVDVPEGVPRTEASDDSFYYLKPTQIVFEIRERNVPAERQGFEVEAEIEQDDGSTYQLFHKDIGGQQERFPEYFEPGSAQAQQDGELEGVRVRRILDNFVDIQFDSEIPDEVACEFFRDADLEEFEFECIETEEQTRDLYSSEVAQEDIEDPCP